ncbi:hypothetical protein FACS1894101_3760 [Betaproteobacteria bacterium]|nr:hypothetical protein FACS1894101_3760 [Betaproteobacteria bacterium]
MIKACRRVTLFLGFFAVSCGVQGDEFLPRLNLDLSATTVSGISSGAFMAVQMGVAHSANIKGVAATAGGPYFCAGEASWMGAASGKAMARCMQGDPALPATPITAADQGVMQAATEDWAERGLIDATDHLAAQKVWIFHGYNDGIVKTPVSEALRDYYQAFTPQRQIFYKHELPAAHAQISASCKSGDKGANSCNPCATTGGNFINTCVVGKTAYDAAGSALQFFYGALTRTASNALKGEVLEFDQSWFTLRDGEEIAPNRLALAETGYLYVQIGRGEGGDGVAQGVEQQGDDEGSDNAGDLSGANDGSGKRLVARASGLRDQRGGCRRQREGQHVGEGGDVGGDAVAAHGFGAQTGSSR